MTLSHIYSRALLSSSADSQMQDSPCPRTPLVHLVRTDLEARADFPVFSPSPASALVLAVDSVLLRRAPHLELHHLPLVTLHQPTVLHLPRPVRHPRLVLEKAPVLLDYSLVWASPAAVPKAPVWQDCRAVDFLDFLVWDVSPVPKSLPPLPQLLQHRRMLRRLPLMLFHPMLLSMSR
jgi:hypothetical protein